jgi:hypothetical protein
VSSRCRGHTETRSRIHPLQESSGRALLSVPPRVDAPTTHPAPREVSMKRVSILISLSVSLCAGSGVASAQKTDGPFIMGNIDSTCHTSGAGAGTWSITCGDIAPGSGTTLIEPSSLDAELAPDDVVPASIPSSESAPEPVAVDDPATEVPADAVGDTATEPDTDGDGLSDAYEINVHATDPGLWDTDGDGLSGGDEVLTTGTDPFRWDTDGDGVADGDARVAVTDQLDSSSSPEGTAETTAGASSEDSDADRLADLDEATAGTDPSTPDSDGDGYYDGDEVNLGTEPLDPTSFPGASDSPESS